MPKLDEIDRAVAHHLSQAALLRKIRNRSSAVNRLPPEILGQILAGCLPETWGWEWREFQKVLDTTSICHHWRAVALATPQLWTMLPGCHSAATTFMLERAGGVPLTLDTLQGQAYGRGEEIVALIQSHMPRIRVLRLGEPMIWNDISPALTQSAPLIESLEILGDHSTNIALPLTLFAQDAPRLRSLSLAHITLPMDLPFLPQLRALSLKAPRLPLAISSVLDALNNMPDLVSLELKIAIDPASTVLSSRPRILLGKLRHLKVTDASRTLLCLAQHLDVPAVHDVELLSYAPGPDSGAGIVRVTDMLRSDIIRTFLTRWAPFVRIAEFGYLSSVSMPWNDFEPRCRDFTISLSSSRRNPVRNKFTRLPKEGPGPYLSICCQISLYEAAGALQSACVTMGPMITQLADLRSLRLLTLEHPFVDRAVWTTAFPMPRSNLTDLIVTGPWAPSLLDLLVETYDPAKGEFTDVEVAEDSHPDFFLHGLTRLTLEGVDFEQWHRGFPLTAMFKDCLRRRRVLGLEPISVVIEACRNLADEVIAEIEENGWAREVIWDGRPETDDEHADHEFGHDPYDPDCDCDVCLVEGRGAYDDDDDDDNDNDNDLAFW
jgi:hypothetical protein